MYKVTIFDYSGVETVMLCTEHDPTIAMTDGESYVFWWCVDIVCVCRLNYLYVMFVCYLCLLSSLSGSDTCICATLLFVFLPMLITSLFEVDECIVSADVTKHQVLHLGST